MSASLLRKCCCNQQETAGCQECTIGDLITRTLVLDGMELYEDDEIVDCPVGDNTDPPPFEWYLSSARVESGSLNGTYSDIPQVGGAGSCIFQKTIYPSPIIVTLYEEIEFSGDSVQLDEMRITIIEVPGGTAVTVELKNHAGDLRTNNDYWLLFTTESSEAGELGDIPHDTPGDCATARTIENFAQDDATFVEGNSKGWCDPGSGQYASYGGTATVSAP